MVLIPAPKGGIINSKPYVMNITGSDLRVYKPGQPTSPVPAFIYIPAFPLLIPKHMFMRGMRSMLS